MYVAVKGGEKSISNAHKLMAEERRGDLSVPEITARQIESQMGLAVDRVMNEGALYDKRLASIAIKQSQGDLVEAAFLLRAYRTTLSRIGFTEPIDTGEMHIRRRISAVYKDLPGGQKLGPTYDYTHRLIDFSLEDEGFSPLACEMPGQAEERGINAVESDHFPRVSDILLRENLIEKDEPPEEDAVPGDLTREPLKVPSDRSTRLQNLVRADEGFILSMSYSVQRGFGADGHPFAGEIRMGEVEVVFTPEELGFPIVIGEISVTECVMITPHAGTAGNSVPRFTSGYGLVFGGSERKAMAMAIADRALRTREFGEEVAFPAQDEEFVLYHSDNVESSGFLQHLKLPHYVDFQTELVTLRKMQEQYENRTSDGEDNDS